LALAGCGDFFGSPADPGLSAAEIVAYVRKDAEDKQAWATAVREGLLAADQLPDADRVCQVMAIIEQESGYAADPAVPGLAEVVERELMAKVEEYGILGKVTAGELLNGKPEGQTKTFGDRLTEVKTERDVDLLYREMMDHYQSQVPLLAESVDLFAPRLDEKFNPVTTAGSMQVNVGFAIELGHDEGLTATEVRDRLYTIEGGVKYGVARLFAHEADYAKPIFRFADFNAGEYSSRNAAFQKQISLLTGAEIAPDGDLMIWEKPGKPSQTDGESVVALLLWRMKFAPDLTEKQVRADLRLEKERKFEETRTWARVKESFEQKMGRKPSYAIVPSVELEIPKLKQGLTPAWFAEKVNIRYEACLKRGSR